METYTRFYLKYLTLLGMIFISLIGCSFRGYSPPPLTVKSEVLPTVIDTPNNILLPSLELTPIPTSTNFSFTSPIIETPIMQTPIPTIAPTLPEFNFNGQIVFAIQSNNHSAVWLLSTINSTPELLLEDTGISFLQPLLSPNGNLLAYIRYANETQTIWVLDLTTRETKQWGVPFFVSYRTLQDTRQASSGLELQTWSPDETKLIYREWKQDAPLSEPVWSYVLSTNGVKKPLGSRVVDLTWSPDNPQEIIYLSQRVGLYQVDLSQMSSPQLIVEIPDLIGGSISWHPNGRALAIVEGFYGSTPLFLLDLETMELQEIGSDVAEGEWVRWSPDGKILFFKHYESIELLEFDPNNLYVETSSVTISHVTPVIDTRQQLWLQNGNYFGLVEGGDTVPGDKDNLCFYTVVGNKVACLLEAENVLQDLSEDLSTSQIAITWSP